MKTLKEKIREILDDELMAVLERTCCNITSLQGKDEAEKRLLQLFQKELEDAQKEEK